LVATATVLKTVAVMAASVIASPAATAAQRAELQWSLVVTGKSRQSAQHGVRLANAGADCAAK